ncbi:dTDP-4-dehydrorhamnose 3,5-epimerase (EC 5.1.3.13) [uncultured Gammaproteobacteria bacterium]|jgi:dTDP-4-dehydrorhamnose 3,5-epimerase|nr:dTDP-4-dehydrorhamnose 3,5-epimerase (EC 5.1.3.13) [uncultured Gammaproteobacteria bacterium]CAC9537938.1 dTDP-4-dehydrorhamnose 3,5-epimerase (EC 5.1.3.13) [uncultured Gammaproteobacteria bacterium]CAC9552481.1 dTDP-4-dehydrorhamnose 3,5-epimerase (EC 5.1.3.13) [uncultured Gammaproteobacteria bacterium]CAC9566260.1 dTDP-4-dehydrorhamnose 3,5-epimerase (EC 5.1.3.13) [uncultured Gammaproteobacteria bacterium]CAC9952508.1 dTDP-4-dehydrorhamnose 3,5-epimerase (EC 5.1.3.13) [uncultured Gammaprot
MLFERLEISDIVLIKPIIHSDDRGYFLETFRQDFLEDFIGEKINFIQDNESKSNKGVLRGLHYQLPPYEQAKLVRVIEGSVLDVVVDIRKFSPTFGNSVTVELSDRNKHQLFIPKGFAHGFVVLSDEAIFAYKVDNAYSSELEKGIIFNDKVLNIDWILPKNQLKLSDKDKDLQEFKEL